MWMLLDMGHALSSTIKGYELEIAPAPTIVTMKSSVSYSFSKLIFLYLPTSPVPSKDKKRLLFPNVEDIGLGTLPYGASLA